jgi:hypothetical protein
MRAGVAETPLHYRWSSYPYYIGIEKRPPWLTTRFILGYFGQDETSTQKNYRRFVEDALAGKTKDPLKKVFASTFLGSPDFIGWVKEKIGDLEASDKRNVPALRKLVEKRSLEEIERTIEELLGRDHPLFKKFCMYVSQQHGGFSLKEIGAHYGLKGPAVSQSNRRLRQQILEDRDFKQLLDRIVRKINSVEC